MIFAHFLIVQKLFFNLIIQTFNTLIEFLLFLIHLLQFFSSLYYFPLRLWILLTANPPYGIFVQLLNIIDPLQHVRNIIDSSFLHLQSLYGKVQIYRGILAPLDQLNEFFSELGQTILLSNIFTHVMIASADTNRLLFIIRLLLYLQLYFFILSFPHVSNIYIHNIHSVWASYNSIKIRLTLLVELHK